MEKVVLTVQAPSQQGFRDNPWMVGLVFGDARPEHRTLVRDNILIPWCNDNCAGENWFVKTKYAYFRSKADAMLFYLRFK